MSLSETLVQKKTFQCKITIESNRPPFTRPLPGNRLFEHNPGHHKIQPTRLRGGGWEDGGRGECFLRSQRDGGGRSHAGISNIGGKLGIKMTKTNIVMSV